MGLNLNQSQVKKGLNRNFIYDLVEFKKIIYLPYIDYCHILKYVDQMARE